jgi:predicted metal-binding membrane protein
VLRLLSQRQCSEAWQVDNTVKVVKRLHNQSLLEGVLKRDRVVVVATLAGVCALAWAYTLAGVGLSMNAFEMTAMPALGTALATPAPWSPSYALLVFAMWWVMMIAMMLPSAAPMVLLFAAVERKRSAQSGPQLGTAAFVAGYLAVWGLFSAGAALVHWALEMTGLLSAMMTPTSTLIGGVVLLAAGLYQLTPFKQRCLRGCRNPVGFIAGHWRAGIDGAFRMGIAHGAFCVGCCWALMALLFFGGVMNLYWIGGLAAYVLAEKLFARGRWFAYATAALLMVWGVSILAGSVYQRAG